MGKKSIFFVSTVFVLGTVLVLPEWSFAQDIKVIDQSLTKAPIRINGKIRVDINYWELIVQFVGILLPSGIIGALGAFFSGRYIFEE